MNINVTVGVTPEVKEILSNFIVVLKVAAGVSETTEQSTAILHKVEAAPLPDQPGTPVKKARAKKETPAPLVADFPEDDNDDFLNEKSDKEIDEELTLETIRAKATEKSVNGGKRTEVKALLAKYKAENLAGLKPDDYQNFYSELVKL